MKINLKNIILILVLVTALTSFSFSALVKEKEGIVDNEETAIQIAELLLHSVYGDKIDKSFPFKAKSIKNDKVWYVEGTLNYDRGGIPYIEIQKSDCKILRFGHTK